MCRQCGAHFSSTDRPRPAIVLTPRAPVETAPPPRAVESSSLLRRFDGLWKTNRNSVIECFECKRKQEVSGAASSTICPSCSAHIDLRDYKISTNFSRAIRTHGEVHVTNKGDMSSSSVRCRNAVIEGRLRGNLNCDQSLRIQIVGRVSGRITARDMLVERRAEIQFFRRLRVTNIEIRGRMSGEIIAQGMVTIRKHAALDGNVTARAINVEKGGVFSGELVIGCAHLEQADLLLTPAAGEELQKKPEVPPGLTESLPAT